ncbi:hypothetical protein SpAn4DRAFT_2679 [Sporomusa ovata]|uniref:Mobilization protein n=1 Tax=Sporomusa ovata TaxID=2378 RepID=A0A0U1L188_9FIRM|nr:hypothetical protein SpAn4DRAFT_2679 [Sporomusa ovata]
MNSQRFRITLPDKEASVLQLEAKLADLSVNQYMCKVLCKRKVVIVPGVRQLYAELYRLRIELLRLQSPNDIGHVNKLIERAETLCQFCGTFLVNAATSINCGKK